MPLQYDGFFLFLILATQKGGYFLRHPAVHYAGPVAYFQRMGRPLILSQSFQQRIQKDLKIIKCDQ